MTANFQNKSLSAIIEIIVRIFLLTACQGYHSVMCSVSEQKQIRNIPSQLSFIMRCLQSWQQTWGQFREQGKEGLSPWVHTTLPLSVTPSLLSVPHKNSSFFAWHCALPCLSLFQTHYFYSLVFLTSSLVLCVSHLSIDPAARPSLSSVKDLRSTGYFWEENCFPWVSFVR